VRAARAAVLVALLTGGLTGCANGTTTITSPPLCRSGGEGAGNGVILMAQAVPTASFVPCVQAAMPLGWSFHHMIARNGVALFWLDSDRDGIEAIEVRLDAICDSSGATEIPSDRDGMRRLERVRRVNPTYAGDRYYLFPGGCLTFVFRLHGDNPGEALALASQVVGTVRRSDLDAQVREESKGRLSLDPAAEEDG
jgi:hypothetical protein